MKQIIFTVLSVLSAVTSLAVSAEEAQLILVANGDTIVSTMDSEICVLPAGSTLRQYDKIFFEVKSITAYGKRTIYGVNDCYRGQVVRLRDARGLQFATAPADVQ